MISIGRDLDPDLDLVHVDRIVDPDILDLDHDRIRGDGVALVAQPTVEKDEPATANIRNRIGVLECLV